MPDFFGVSGAASFEALTDILKKSQGLSDAPEDSPAERRDRAAANDADLDVKLKKILATVALILMAGQVVVADWVFWQYSVHNDWQIPVPAISAWLGATVIEVIGIVYVIASYLFPKRVVKSKR